MSNQQFSFAKACGLGNDFVILSLPKEGFDLSKLSHALADRRYGVGCDQVIFIEETTAEKTFNIRFFNADGSEAEGCGNGSRCVAKLLMDEQGWSDIKLKTVGGTITCRKETQDTVSIQLLPPSWKKNICLKEFSISKAVYVTVGNPHLVCFVNDVNDVTIKGPILETYLHQTDPGFPERVNVGFAKIIDKGNITLNVWERGSGLTPACGTGACAAAVASSLEDLTTKKVTVHQSGGKLEIDWSDDGLFMKGEALMIYQGTISLNLLNGKTK
jgi:diaminopimelate epimerase